RAAAEAATGHIGVDLRVVAIRLLWVLGFAVGLVCLDTVTNAVGGYLLRSAHATDVEIKSLVEARHDVVIVGGFRAALHLGSALLSTASGRRICNAGRVVDGLGRADFVAHLAVPRTRRLILLVDDGNWEETAEFDRPEVVRHAVWLPFLEQNYGALVAARYNLPLL